ncbi:MULTISPECIES: glyceraldehyde-3-phosphate dehydrogenase [unclassified Shewanella]|uniref:glyceraldehyde-3-phosphate dehydrogenase n=1 Tax=unclassified Shewanella TaxID=196818 RepID=UPI0009708D31|nr:MULTISPECIES: glyceraldehyde-3-phosphate dehydrogenase [unclassified Shewanella]MDO6640758.1 glyceraldehyde-3-phosphate dehydrogenase [Shewanella sp. 5_MG-2023]MDO6776383.1 glyceraldehyde-3-phosphate dehydrogenase [Shewanella sp. 3_MG-2023]PMG28432.1 type I glyceraldehyde-3-phosphate dehydrogenase [Shewanella sp. 10N.286.52.C2]PMH89313.1 type I glyceraldehyde-3-phosphate dehydrogenase [Shewanella sp. 10N.286.48.B5]PMI02352.1 type I glyceraldehyde-3-phosphate dehydrogenase [Shewanella sp. 10
MSADKHLQSWQERFEMAEAMQPLLGKLYRNQGVEVLIFGKPLLNASTIEIIKAHRLVRRHIGDKLRLRESFPFVEALSKLSVKHCKVDIGKLAINYWREHSDASQIQSYMTHALEAGINFGDDVAAKDVVLYGFGRIGRLLARLMIEKTGQSNKLCLRAIVLRGGKKGDLEKRASLLRRDSVHGSFNGSVEVDEENNALIANGTYIQIIYANSPDEVDYTQYGINDALVVDNTGIWKDEAGLGLHLKSKGASKVLLTAPAKGAIKNVVYGVNENDILPEDIIVSAASCTTNAITPVLKAVNDKYGIENGHVETIHSYTNDQNLIDNYHSADRRGRSAPLNMVITETGAAKAVSKALPVLEGKLTGNAIRVPTPNVSMAIISVNLNGETNRDELNEYLKDVALTSELRNQIDFTESTEIVSSDLVGSRYAGVVDSQATIAEGKRAILYVWYDNEFGYSCQVVGVMQKMLGITTLSLPSA